MIVRPIVVGVHPNRHEPAPLEFAVTLSCLTGGAPLHVVGTYWFDSTPGRTVRKDFEAAVRREMEEIIGAGGHDEIGCGDLTVTAVAGSAAHMLHETAERVSAGLIVVGAGPHGRGPLGKVGLGSTTDNVLEGAPCPVAVVPRDSAGFEGEASRIGVAFVDTREGRAALRGAAMLAGRLDATLVVQTAVDARTGGGAEEALMAAIEPYTSDCAWEARVLRDGVDGLVESTSELDLLVCGSRGYGQLRSTVLGGVSRQLAHRAMCPLIVVPRGLDRPLAELFGGTGALSAAS